MAEQAKVKEAVTVAGPVVKKLAKDEEFRQSVIGAVTMAKAIYDQLGDDKNVKALANRIATDPKLQKELSKQLQDVQKTAKKATKESHKKRNALILAGIIVGLLYNPATGPQTRRWLKDRVGGGDETFEYDLDEIAPAEKPAGSETNGAAGE